MTKLEVDLLVSNMRVLIIEDDRETADAMKLMLESEQFHVFMTELGQEGIELGKSYFFDAILLDINLPDISGFQVLTELRASKVTIPIIICSGLAGIEDRVRGLEKGADDYLTKPFHKDELLARLHAALRRSNNATPAVIKAGHLTINLETQQVYLKDRSIDLTDHEYLVLELMGLRKGSALTRQHFGYYLENKREKQDSDLLDRLVKNIQTKMSARGVSGDIFADIGQHGYVLSDHKNIVVIPRESEKSERVHRYAADVRQADLFSASYGGSFIELSQDRYVVQSIGESSSDIKKWIRDYLNETRQNYLPDDLRWIEKISDRLGQIFEILDEQKQDESEKIEALTEKIAQLEEELKSLKKKADSSKTAFEIFKESAAKSLGDNFFNALKWALISGVMLVASGRMDLLKLVPILKKLLG